MNRIVKRDGSIVTFDSKKIEQAILKAAKVTKEFTEAEVSKVTNKVILMAQEIASKKESNLKAPTVEEVQDAVEIALYSFGYTIRLASKRKFKHVIFYSRFKQLHCFKRKQNLLVK